MAWNVEFYKNESGKCPVTEFIDSITDKKLKAKVLHDIELLGEHGTQLKRPKVDFLEDGIWELRTQQSNNIARTLYFTYTGKTIVLLHGFIKKRQRTPESDKTIAKKNKSDYLRRNSNGL